MIKKGLLLRVNTITEPEAIKSGENLWRIVEIVNDVVFLQAISEKMDSFGNIQELFCMRRSELELSPNLEVVDESVIPKKTERRQREGRKLPMDQ